MKNKNTLAPFVSSFNRSCCILMASILLVFQGCFRDDSSEPTDLTPKWYLNLFVRDIKTHKPLNNVMVEVMTNRYLTQSATTNADGKVQITLHETDSGNILITPRKSGYFNESMLNQFTYNNMTITLEMEQSSYMRCHVINLAPVSTNEKVVIGGCVSGDGNHTYIGATDITFISEMTRSAIYTLYWDSIFISSNPIPVTLISGDTTDVTITF